MNDKQRDALRKIEEGMAEFRAADDWKRAGWDKDRQEVIQAFCDIASDVGRRYFRNEYGHDCFCQRAEERGSYPMTFWFSEKIIDFIRDAVEDKMERSWPWEGPDDG